MRDCAVERLVVVAGRLRARIALRLRPYPIEDREIVVVEVHLAAMQPLRLAARLPMACGCGAHALVATDVPAPFHVVVITFAGALLKGLYLFHRILMAGPFGSLRFTQRARPVDAIDELVLAQQLAGRRHLRDESKTAGRAAGRPRLADRTFRRDDASDERTNGKTQRLHHGAEMELFACEGCIAPRPAAFTLSPCRRPSTR